MSEAVGSTEPYIYSYTDFVFPTLTAGWCISCGYSRQRDDSHPGRGGAGWHEILSHYSQQLHNLKLMNCLFLEVSI